MLKEEMLTNNQRYGWERRMDSKELYVSRFQQEFLLFAIVESD